MNCFLYLLNLLLVARNISFNVSLASTRVYWISTCFLSQSFDFLLSLGNFFLKISVRLESSFRMLEILASRRLSHRLFCVEFLPFLLITLKVFKCEASQFDYG